jgi:hypothetical protein
MHRKKSLSLSFHLKMFVCLTLVLGLSACADYLDRRDTVTLGAGDAQAWNQTIQAADPWPRYVMDTHIPGDGRRTAGVIQRYSTGNTGSALEQVTDSAGDAAGGVSK